MADVALQPGDGILATGGSRSPRLQFGRFTAPRLGKTPELVGATTRSGTASDPFDPQSGMLTLSRKATRWRHEGPDRPELVEHPGRIHAGGRAIRRSWERRRGKPDRQSENHLSIINLASVKDVERIVRAPFLRPVPRQPLHRRRRTLAGIRVGRPEIEIGGVRGL